MEFKNNIKKILTNKKDTLSTKLFIIDNLKKIINTKRIFIKYSTFCNYVKKR